MKQTLALAAVLCAVPPAARAHLTNTGLGPFYDGLAHLFVTPDALLPAIAISLLAGLRGPRYGRMVLLALPAACLAGSLVSRWIGLPAALPATTAAATIVVGILVAADLRLPLVVLAGAAILLGLLNGGAQPAGLSAAGSAVALFVVAALLAGRVVSIQTFAARIVVRVAGSWIAASGLFLLGWALRPSI
jgi:urease accessory protein